MISDALNHASIIDGCRIVRPGGVHPHGDLRRWSGCSRKRSAQASGFVTDSVFSMDGDGGPVWAAKAADKVRARLITDDAHGWGDWEDRPGAGGILGLPGADIQVGDGPKPWGQRAACCGVPKSATPCGICPGPSFSYGVGAGHRGCSTSGRWSCFQAAPKRYVGRLQENARYMRGKLAAAGCRCCQGRQSAGGAGTKTNPGIRQGARKWGCCAVGHSAAHRVPGQQPDSADWLPPPIAGRNWIGRRR